jgi:hypothetical protein
MTIKCSKRQAGTVPIAAIDDVKHWLCIPLRLPLHACCLCEGLRDHFNFLLRHNPGGPSYIGTELRKLRKKNGCRSGIFLGRRGYFSASVSRMSYRRSNQLTMVRGATVPNMKGMMCFAMGDARLEVSYCHGWSIASWTQDYQKEIFPSSF